MSTTYNHHSRAIKRKMTSFALRDNNHDIESEPNGPWKCTLRVSHLHVLPIQRN